MTKDPDRFDMTARVVPLASDAAGDARVGGTVAERLALVAELSRRAWELTKKPWPPSWPRGVPARVRPLAEQD